METFFILCKYTGVTLILGIRNGEREKLPSSDNGMAPTKRQTFIWTNVGLITDAYMRHSASASQQRMCDMYWIHSFLQFIAP